MRLFTQQKTKPNDTLSMPQESAQNTGMMLGFYLDPDTVKKLAIPGGEPPEELHVTEMHHIEIFELIYLSFWVPRL